MNRRLFGWIFPVLIATATWCSSAAPIMASGPQPVLDNIPFDISSQLKGQQAPIQPGRSSVAQTAATHDGRAPDLVLSLYDWSANHEGSYEVPFWREWTSSKTQVFVAWDDLAAPPTSGQQYQTITQNDISYIGHQMDQKILPSDVDHFGNYIKRPAGDPTISVMIYNIRDDAYWTNDEFYIAGYFWASLNAKANRNMIFLDSFDWPNRTKADTEYPFLYEGTAAHELEHLIHNDIDPDEVAFIDEGLADLAQYYAGYGHPVDHIAYYLIYHRDSLTDWDGELYDYGGAYLWQLYLQERFGTGFSKRLVAEQDNGMAGVQNVLRKVAPKGTNLADVFRDWTLANLLDGRTDNPAWNYRSLQIPSANTWNYSIQWSVENYYGSEVRGTIPPTRKNVLQRGTVEPWGAYYVAYKGSEPSMLFTFDGNDREGVAPVSGTLEWFGGTGNGLNNTLSRSMDLTGKTTLSFKTWYDIEENWDYGYVEASSDGKNWQALTPISSIPYGTVDVNHSDAWHGPGGLTGNSGGWVTATFDLSGFVGTVSIRLRYATDEAANGFGWYVDDMVVRDGTGTVLFADPMETTNQWNAAGWTLTSGLVPNEFALSVAVPHQRGKEKWTDVVHVRLDPSTEVGTQEVNTRSLSGEPLMAVINNHPDGQFDGGFLLAGLKSK